MQYHDIMTLCVLVFDLCVLVWTYPPSNHATTAKPPPTTPTIAHLSRPSLPPHTIAPPNPTTPTTRPTATTLPPATSLTMSASGSTIITINHPNPKKSLPTLIPYPNTLYPPLPPFTLNKI